MKQFEQRLERLEALSDEIRDSDIPLEKAIACFEEGIKLAKSLEKDLEKIEGKIQVLMNGSSAPEEKPELELFDEQDTDD